MNSNNQGSQDEANWMREKQGLPPLPPRDNHQPSSQEELNWMREKQGLPPLPPSPGGSHSPSPEELNWMREKQGLPPLANPGAPASSPEELNWMREKQGLPPLANPAGSSTSPQEINWMREKQGLPPLPVAPQRPPSSAQTNQWMREKQGLPPIAAPPPKSKLPAILLGVIGLLVVAVIGLVALLVVLPGLNKAATPTAQAGLATTTPTTRRVAVFTPPPTVPPTEALEPTVAATGESQKILALGQEAVKNKRWAEAIQAFETISPTDPNYAAAKPLLVQAYFELATQAAQQNPNSQESANQAVTYFHKAQQLDPEYAGLKAATQKAELYAQARLQYDSDQCCVATPTLEQLYKVVKSEKPDGRYRDTAELYYNCLIAIGDDQAKPNNKQGWANAKSFYIKARDLDVANKTVAISKINEADQALSKLG
jgi:hypothetical protein